VNIAPNKQKETREGMRVEKCLVKVDKIKREREQLSSCTEDG